METKLTEYLQKNDVVFAHVITVAGYFSKNIVSFVLENEALQPGKHIFIVTDSDDTEKMQSENVFYIRNLKRKEQSVLDKIAPYTKYIVLHFMDFELIKTLKTDLAKKIIWRTWGNDLSYKVSYVPSIKLKLKMLYKKWIWNTKGRKLARNFAAIAISASECDRLELKRQKIQNVIYRLPYPTKYWQEDFEKILQTESGLFQKRDGELWVMIGHSANSALKHEKILKMLAKFRGENIRIVMPMSYGRMEYRERVRTTATALFGDKVSILDDNLPYEEYVRLLSKIDVAFFDSKHQMALGNIVDLLLLGKTVFLNEKGIVYKTLAKQGVDAYACADAKKYTFADLQKICREHDPSKGVAYAKGLRNKQFVVSDWEKLLNDFENK